jgi:hypothetical protein
VGLRCTVRLLAAQIIADGQVVERSHALKFRRGGQWSV